MNKKLLKNAVCFLTLLVLIAPIMVAAGTNPNPLNNGNAVDDPFGTGSLSSISGLPKETTDVPTIVTNIINLILGFLALIAIVIVLIGGFEWMTAGGNDDKVKTAQKRLKYGLIGLVIIFVAYGVVTYVMTTLPTLVGGGA